MSANEYLNNLVYQKANSSDYTQNEEQAYRTVAGWINEWKQSLNNGGAWNSAHAYAQNGVDIEMQKSGSRAKGTSLKGKSDIDIFVSITDSNHNNTTKDYYDSLFTFLKSKMVNNEIRRQNVSIGLNYAKCDIDVTPAKKINHTYSRNQNHDHNLYSHRSKGLVRTNIKTHIDLVRSSGLQKEIMLVKMWRNCHGLELPSIYIEILTVELLKYNRGSLENNVCTIVGALRDTIMTRRVIDPANSNNNISESITYSEKQEIQKTATNFFGKSWNSIIW